MSLTHPDHARVSIYGMRDSAVYDDVAHVSRTAVALGASVVSSQDAPQIEAYFSNITQATAFAIWLSRRLYEFHTYQLTQVTNPTQTPWPERDAERVKANCISLALNYNEHARRWNVTTLPEAHTSLVAVALARMPLLQLKQEIADEDVPPPAE